MDQIGTTGIISYSDFAGYQSKSAGSSMLRAEAIAETNSDFSIYKHGSKYDNLIFQKAYWKEMMQNSKSAKILDLCDPDWIIGNLNIIELGNLVDAITCSSLELTQVVKNFFPKKIVEHVPDRLNLKSFPLPRGPHFGRAKNLVWFGYIPSAYETLPLLLPYIRANKLSLTIISNREHEYPQQFEDIDVKFILYQKETAYLQIKEADIALNPISHKAYFKYKSNNKSLISWKLGVPVAKTVEDLEYLLVADNRNLQVQQQSIVVNEQYDISFSAQQYRQIINTINSRR